MTAPTVPTAPALCSVPNIELMHVGQWDISTGTATFTRDDLRAAVAALDCPAVRRPVLKLGHTDPRFDGEPAIGWIDNLALAEDDRTLVADYVGMPGWLGPILASAYPDRSIEGWWDFTCQLGHVHPFVLTAVALLGVTAPGIGTLQSLQDVAALYGVAAATSPSSGAPITLTVHASQGGTVPNPAPQHVAASATTEDVRRAFYDDAPWSQWIEEIQLEPLQLIVIDDETGQRFRVSVTVDPASDGEDSVSFAAPIPVVIRYEDQAAVAASGAPRRVTYASRAESRPGQRPAAATQTPAEPPETPPTNTEEADTMSDTLIQGLRQRLGVTDDSLDEAGLLSALDEALAEHAEPAAASMDTTIPAGSVVVPRVQLEELQTAAAAGVEARNRQLTEDRDREIAAAVADGRIAPSRREHWEQAYAADRAGASAALASLPKGLIPVAASGYAGNEPDVDPAAGDDYWFTGVPAAATSKEG